MGTSVRSRIQQGLVLTCVVLGIVSTAWGDLVSVQVTGAVDNSSFDSIETGSLVTGLYTYDDTLVPRVAPPGTLAWYLPIAVSVAFADGSSLSTDEGMIMVHNDTVVTGMGTFDIYAVGFDDIPFGSGGQTGAFAAYSAHGWMVARSNPTGMAWDSLALPDPEIVLERLLVDESLLLFDYPSGGTGNYIFLHITDLSVVPAPVPVPGALVLAAIGAGCCRRLFRRRTT